MPYIRIQTSSGNLALREIISYNWCVLLLLFLFLAMIKATTT